MKALVVAGLLFAAGAVNAQRVSLLEPCAELVTPRPLPKVVKPAGLPEQLRGSCKAEIEANEIGAAIGFWCLRTPPKPPVLYLYAVRWNAVTPSLLADFALIGTAGDNRQRIADMQAKHQTENVLDMCDVWGPARERINAARPQP